MNPQKSENKSYHNQGNPELLSLVADNHKNALDLGCGTGANARILVSHGIKVDGVTLSKAEKESVKGVCDKCVIFNLEKGLPEELKSSKYDVIIASHVLEHICYPQKLLSDIKATLQPDGNLIVAVPNIMHYKYRLQLLFGVFKYTDSGIMDYTHFRWYTYKSLRKLLEQNGFKISKYKVAGKLPFYRLARYLGVNLNQKLYSLIAKLAPGLFGYQIIAVVTVQEQ